ARRHATAGPVPRLVEDSHRARFGVDTLDPGAVKDAARGVGAGVVDHPLAVRRPDAGVGQDVAAGPERELLLHAGPPHPGSRAASWSSCASSPPISAGSRGWPP